MAALYDWETNGSQVRWVDLFAGVAVAVGVGVTVLVGVEEMIGVIVGVAVGDWQKVETVTVPTLPPPETERTRVPNSPLVLTLVDAPALS